MRLDEEVLKELKKSDISQMIFEVKLKFILNKFSLVNKMKISVPVEITSKYPRTSTLKFPNGEVERLRVPKAFFVPDHNQEREYWKGFEIVEWSSGDKELRLCYWTREKGTETWRWGQFNTIISVDKLRALLRMVEKEIT